MKEGDEGPGRSPPPADVDAPGEFELIERYFRRGHAGAEAVARITSGAADADAEVVLGIGDDAAILALPPGTELVVSVDTLVSGRHFPRNTCPRSIGHRSLAVNLSDLAAMGATPAWATLALTLPQADPAWLEGFSSGFLELASASGVALVGGDTTRGPLTISVQIMGLVPRGTALRRSGAHPGDLLAVTGTLGDAAAGLALRQGSLSAPSDAAEFLFERFDFPQARVAFGREARGLATSAMDLSDGLAGDLPKLAAASGLAAHVDVTRLPISDALRAVSGAERSLEWALSGGDDYEILLTVPAARFAELAERAARLNLMLTPIGKLGAGSGVAWSKGGRAFHPVAKGYDHFA